MSVPTTAAQQLSFRFPGPLAPAETPRKLNELPNVDKILWSLRKTLKVLLHCFNHQQPIHTHIFTPNIVDTGPT
jgi:hypothetical protein